MDAFTRAVVHEDFLASRTQTEYECNHPEEKDDHYPIGECIYCGGEIYADDVGFVLNEEDETGICKACLRDKCVWR